MAPGELPADAFAATAGSSLLLLRRQTPPDGGAAAAAGPQFGEVVVAHGAPVCTTRWNRNNKVVAAGSDDGTVQLLYSSGQVMCVLPRDGTPPSAFGPITSLAWSTGSKRLAAGSGNGNVYIHDMQNKGLSTLGGHLGGVTALEYQHEDKFLAVASAAGSVVIYADPHKPSGAAPTALPLPPPPSDPASARLCLSLASGGEAAVAAGSAAGGVAVWDAPSRRAVQEFNDQHGGEAVHALAFVPTKPAWLYSAGGDGRVCLLDRSAGPGRVASVIQVGAPATALMLREDHSVLGVGTAEGVVRLYDPRHMRQPLQTLRFPGGEPITSLHWQHRFTSLSFGSRHHRSAAAGSHAASGLASGLTSGFGGQPSASVGPAAAAPSRHGTAPPGSAAAAPSIGSHIPAALAAAAAGSAPGSQASSPPQEQGQGSGSGDASQQQRASGASAAPASLAVTPLAAGPGRRPPAAALPAAGEVTPAAGKQRLGAPGLPASVPGQHGEQQLSITPLPGQPREASAAAASQAPSPGGPPGLHASSHAPALAVTPLVPQHAAAAAQAPAQAAAHSGPAAGLHSQLAPAQLDVSPLSTGGSPQGSGSGLGGRGADSLCISPLPGMALPPAVVAGTAGAASPRQQQQRSVLGERSTNSPGRVSNRTLGPAGNRMLPGLAPPLPPAGASPQQPARSPSFAENLPLPTPPGRKQQEEVCSAAAAEAGPGGQHKALKAAAAGAGSTAALDSPGSSQQEAGRRQQQWSIPAAQQQAAAAADAAGDSPPPGVSQEFSFAAAQHSVEELAASGAAWGSAVAGICAQQREALAGAAAGAPLAAAGGAAGGAEALRDELLAMHLDMLSQFQAQQACMGQLVGQVLERNEALSGEVAALRRQLAALTARRDDFLWL